VVLGGDGDTETIRNALLTREDAGKVLALVLASTLTLSDELVVWFIERLCGEKQMLFSRVLVGEAR
jgi:hypothetical protein